MDTIIYYKSVTGYTKEYTELLKTRIGAEAYEISKMKTKDIKEAKNIFFGGPIRNGKILGLSKFLKKYKYMKDKNVFIYAVGIEPADENKRHIVIITNSLDDYHVRLYFLQGGISLERMKFPQKQFFNFGLKVAGKNDKNMQFVMSNLKNGVNFVSSSNLNRMIEVYNKVKK